MKLTVYNPTNRNQKYTIHYRPSYDQVIEGTFTIEDEHGKSITLPEYSLYDDIKQIFVIEIGRKLIEGSLNNERTRST